MYKIYYFARIWQNLSSILKGIYSLTKTHYFNRIIAIIVEHVHARHGYWMYAFLFQFSISYTSVPIFYFYTYIYRSRICYLHLCIGIREHPYVPIFFLWFTILVHSVRHQAQGRIHGVWNWGKFPPKLENCIEKTTKITKIVKFFFPHWIFPPPKKC